MTLLSTIDLLLWVVVVHMTEDDALQDIRHFGCSVRSRNWLS